jgi:hypothetical protein
VSAEGAWAGVQLRSHPNWGADGVASTSFAAPQTAPLHSQRAVQQKLTAAAAALNLTASAAEQVRAPPLSLPWAVLDSSGGLTRVGGATQVTLLMAQLAAACGGRHSRPLDALLGGCIHVVSRERRAPTHQATRGRTGRQGRPDDSPKRRENSTLAVRDPLRAHSSSCAFRNARSGASVVWGAERSERFGVAVALEASTFSHISLSLSLPRQVCRSNQRAVSVSEVAAAVQSDERAVGRALSFVTLTLSDAASVHLAPPPDAEDYVARAVAALAETHALAHPARMQVRLRLRVCVRAGAPSPGEGDGRLEPCSRWLGAVRRAERLERGLAQRGAAQRHDAVRIARSLRRRANQRDTRAHQPRRRDTAMEKLRIVILARVWHGATENGP